MEQIRNYTGYGWQGQNYQRDLDIKEIAKIIRTQLKKDFPECKFSVSIKRYSGGQSLYIHLMESPFKISTDPEFKGHYQLNEYMFLEQTEYGIERIFEKWEITPQLFYIMQKVSKFVRSYNYDDSDGMIDYFDTNFYLHLNVGKWDKPYKQIN